MTLGSLFLVFEGPGKRLEFRWIFKDSLGTPGSEATHPVEGNFACPGGKYVNIIKTFWLSHTSYKAVSCKLTGSEGLTRLSTCKLSN